MLKIGTLIEFINLGGNVLMASDTYNDPMRDFAVELTATFEDFNVIDPVNTFFDESVKGDIVPVDSIVKEVNSPILFKGIAHKLTKKNPIIIPILVAGATSYSPQNSEGDITKNTNVGSANVLVSAFQSRTNARVVFSGSSSLFSDKYIYCAKLTLRMRTTKLESGSNPGNKEFVQEVTQWVFQEKSVLKLIDHKHHRASETEQHGIYRIKEDLVIFLT